MVSRRVLIAYGSAHGSTAEIAEWIGETLRGNNFIAEVHPAADVHFLEGYDAVVLGGALYATRWHRDARRFVRRHRHALRSRPVWLFSSGPLDDSADRDDIPPTRGVARIARRIRARGHMTFGGSIANNDGFMARSMAKKMERTDFRNVALVKAWANDLANALDAGDARSESLVARRAIDQARLQRDPA
jgi:menaquinone-dependent protoporphyrinogen oxidase